MRRSYLLLLLLLLFSATNIFANEDEGVLKYGPEDVSFFIGHINNLQEDLPDFKSISGHEWVSINFLRKHRMLTTGELWIRIDLPKGVHTKNYIFLNSLRNQLTIYYPKKMYPKHGYQEQIDKLSAPGAFEGTIVPLEFNGNYMNDSASIYISIDRTKDTPMFKFFPFVLGNKEELTSYVRQGELAKKRTDFGFFFIGNFLIFASLVSLIIFFFTIKKLNISLLLFALLMGTAGIFYWMLSPLSLIFSDYTHTRLLTLVLNYHLIWFFFGLLVANFFKKKILFLNNFYSFTYIPFKLLFIFITINYNYAL
jgi:hypothetical protein